MQDAKASVGGSNLALSSLLLCPWAFRHYLELGFPQQRNTRDVKINEQIHIKSLQPNVAHCTWGLMLAIILMIILTYLTFPITYEVHT